MQQTSFRSTNGRWGLNVLAPTEIKENVPIKGTLENLGRAAGFSNYKLTPHDAQTYIVILGDIEPIEGTPITVVENQSLQSSKYITLTIALPGATWKSYGYNRRSAAYYSLNQEGRIVRAPTSLLLATGAIQPKEPPPPIPLPSPPEGAMAEAMRKAGLIL